MKLFLDSTGSCMCELTGVVLACSGSAQDMQDTILAWGGAVTTKSTN